MRSFCSAMLLVLLLPLHTSGQATDPVSLVADLPVRYSVMANVTYLVADNYQAQLDVYLPRSASAAAPAATVIMIHGGGWTGGDKNVAMLRLLPWLQMGWAAVNINYRTGNAPAAVEDSRCALRWVMRNAARYHFNVNKLVVTGESAGSHLALTTGMLPAAAGLDSRCPGPEELKVAAIVNWYGVTDVVDVAEGVNQQQYAVRWLGEQPDRLEMARRVSPMQYVRAGLPGIFTIHGDADMVAPYQQAVRLHRALDEARVPNQLITIPGGGHGTFSGADYVRIYAALRAFLQTHGLIAS